MHWMTCKRAPSQPSLRVHSKKLHAQPNSPSPLIAQAHSLPLQTSPITPLPTSLAQAAPQNTATQRGHGRGRGRWRGDSRPNRSDSTSSPPPPSIPTLTASSGRRSLATTTTLEGSSTPGSATARAIKAIVEASLFDASVWLLHELTQFNVKINRTSFPKESREVIFNAVDTVLKLAVSMPQHDPLAFSSYSDFILFPRLILKSLRPGYQGRHAALALARRCEMLMDGRVAELIEEAHDSRVKRVARKIHDVTKPTIIFKQAARAAALAICGAVG